MKKLSKKQLIIGGFLIVVGLSLLCFFLVRTYRRAHAENELKKELDEFDSRAQN
ncbi:MAG: hypothetical protein LBQ95_02070 [Lachnospiraceae bacterium]|nr:hypothetical protein [Lachnospiraceae bacterium]